MATECNFGVPVFKILGYSHLHGDGGILESLNSRAHVRKHSPHVDGQPNCDFYKNIFLMARDDESLAEFVTTSGSAGPFMTFLSWAQARLSADLLPPITTHLPLLSPFYLIAKDSVK